VRSSRHALASTALAACLALAACGSDAPHFTAGPSTAPSGDVDASASATPPTPPSAGASASPSVKPSASPWPRMG
jgi:hypothetical protein